MRVALFITCVNDTLFPDTGRATVTVLERLGHEVVFPLADHHVCVVHARQVVATVPDAIAAVPHRAPHTDLGAVRHVGHRAEHVEGVHSPRNLNVVVVR